jgi:hypothetical protein
MLLLQYSAVRGNTNTTYMYVASINMHYISVWKDNKERGKY